MFESYAKPDKKQYYKNWLVVIDNPDWHKPGGLVTVVRVDPCQTSSGIRQLPEIEIVRKSMLPRYEDDDDGEGEDDENNFEDTQQGISSDLVCLGRTATSIQGKKYR